MSALRILSAALLCLSGAVAIAQVPAEQPDLDLWDHGAAFTTEYDLDGHLLVGGLFTLAGGEPSSNLARLLLPGGDIDEDFAPDIDGPVFSILQQADGAILIGGLFSQVNGVARDNLARLNADGSVDPDFNPGADEAVYAFALDGADHLVIGGTFTSVAGQTRNGLARLALADGQLDAGWNPAVTGNDPFSGVFALVRDGSEFWIGGNFDQVGGQASRALARLDADGALLAGYTVDGNVEGLSFDSEGRLFLCGPFAGVDGQTRSRLARLDASGSLDAFSIDVDQDIHDCRSSGTDVLVSGQFVAINGEPLSGVARLSSAGAVDADFRPLVGGVYNGTPGSDVLLWTLRELQDDRTFIGGVFQQVNGAPGVGAALLDSSDGALGVTINLERPASVRTIAALDSGDVVIGGRFWRSGPHPRTNVARLLADGSLDIDWSLQVNGEVLSAEQLADGSLVLGGFFSRVDGQDRANLARIDVDAAPPAVQTGWTVGANGPVLVVQQDQLAADRVYVAGAFSEILADQAHPRGRMARLSLNDAGLPDGFDPAFLLPGLPFAPQVNDVLQLPASEHLYVAGVFTRAAGQTRIGLAAFTDAANLPQFDAGFDAAANDALWVLQQAGDGQSFYLGGFFTSLFGQARAGLGKIGPGQQLQPWAPAVAGGTPVAMALDDDDGLFVGGDFLSIENGPARLGRLDAGDGTLDGAFNPGLAPGVVWDLSVSPGRLLAAGSFETAGGATRVGLAGFELELPDPLFADRFEQETAPAGTTRGIDSTEQPARLRQECLEQLMRSARGQRPAFYRAPGCQ